MDPAASAGGLWARVKNLLAAPGPVHWALPPECASSFRPLHSSLLQVTAGQAWVTLRGASALALLDHDSASLDSGDYFLQAGDSLRVAAGQHLVLEAAGLARVQGVLSRA